MEDFEDKIRKWFELRFERKPEHDKFYFQEWLDRFKKGYAQSFMDLEALKLWDVVSKED